MRDRGCSLFGEPACSTGEKGQNQPAEGTTVEGVFDCLAGTQRLCVFVQDYNCVRPQGSLVLQSPHCLRAGRKKPTQTTHCGVQAALAVDKARAGSSMRPTAIVASGS